jgi:hypothetical protein
MPRSSARTSSTRRCGASRLATSSSGQAVRRPTDAWKGCSAPSLEECWKPAFARYLIPKYTGLRLDLERYLHYYNSDRVHTGRLTRGRTPEDVIGKVKMWSR